MKANPVMKKLTADDPAAKSADVVADNIVRLKELFPEAFSEGRVDFETLKQLLGGVIDEREEKYGLNWHGKRQARQLALSPSTGTLRPSPEDSLDWDTTQNLMIEGDNLEVLKLLQKSYAGKVKLIYIDPPYNTGGDFVYPDDFRDPSANYLRVTGQVGESGYVSTNVESDGRFHTKWLNMMYPRLRLARNLLRTDGVLFVTIDDAEFGNLRLLGDEIFGGENFVASIAWKKRSSPDARDTIGSVHDWILCYAREISLIKSAIGKMPLGAERIEAYANPDNDPRGAWASVDMTGMTGRATKDQYFKVTLPSGRVIGPPEGRSWGLAERTFLELREDNRIWFGKTGDSVPRIKRFLKESEGQVVPSLWDSDEVGSNEEAKKEANGLLGMPNVFDTPKPVRLIQRMIQVATKKDDIVLDFFAGSGTTAHAVMDQNVKDAGRRRFVLVQLPEPLRPGVKTQEAALEFCKRRKLPAHIASLTNARLRESAAELRKNEGAGGVDLGFRVFKLASSNIRQWAPTSSLAETLEQSVEHLKTDRTEEDILYEVLIKLGLDLCVPIETRKIEGVQVHAVGGGVLLACLAERLSKEKVVPLAEGIVAWHRALEPAGATTCIFRDSSFVDDVAKTNLAATLHQHGLVNVRSL